MSSEFDYIHDLVDTDMYRLYSYQGELLLEARGLKKLKQLLKETVEPPRENKKVFCVNFGLIRDETDSDSRFAFLFGCFQFTVTTKLALISDYGDIGQNITYTINELRQYPFQLDHIEKAMQMIRDENYIGTMNMSITTLLNLF